MISRYSGTSGQIESGTAGWYIKSSERVTPGAVPGVAASLMWGFLYLPSVSPISELFGVAPLSQSAIVYSMANVAVWGGTGFNMLVLYTNLRAVPQDLYQAARIDGASELQIALRVKIPILAPAIILTTVFSIIATEVSCSAATTRIGTPRNRLRVMLLCRSA